MPFETKTSQLSPFRVGTGDQYANENVAVLSPHHCHFTFHTSVPLYVQPGLGLISSWC